MTVAAIVIQGYVAIQLARMIDDPESYERISPELYKLLEKMFSNLSGTDLSNAGNANISLGALTPAELGQLSGLLADDQVLPEPTRAALSDALRSSSTQSVALEPKCAELPGEYLLERHAQCWEEIANQPGCYVWNPHYHSDRTTQWSGQCLGGVVEGRGTMSVSAGSEHRSYKGTGSVARGKAHGQWSVRYGDGAVHEGAYVGGEAHGKWIRRESDGKVDEVTYENGNVTYAIWRHSNGRVSEGPYVAGKRHGRWIQRDADGTSREVSYVDGEPQSR